MLKFNVRLLIYLKEYDKAIDLLGNHWEHISDYWDILQFFNNIYKLNNDKLDNLLEAYLRLFRINTDLVKYRPSL